jgi:hypothetical protein
MYDIAMFADGSYTSTDIRWEPYLEHSIIEYIWSHTIMRNFCFVYPLPPSTFTTRIPRNYTTGIATNLAEGVEVPVVRQVTDNFDITVVKYGTGCEMTDESKETDWLGILGQAQVEEAALRMLRKENADILAVLLAGAGYGSNAVTPNRLAYEDLVYGRAFMYNKLRHPDITIVNADQLADLQVDPRFTAEYASGTTQTLREGVVGRVAGQDIVTLPEMPTGTAIMMDTKLRPLWFVERQGAKIERYRSVRRQSDGFVITAWGIPCMVRPDCVYQISNC